MKTIKKIGYILSVLLLFSINIAVGQQIAFTNVTVIDVLDGVAKPAMTVITNRERISEVGPVNTTEVPAGATVIDATGKFMIPGLWDMHTHNTWNSFNLFIANGITGVREMGLSRLALPEILVLRQKVQDGELIGPRFVAAGPTVNGIKSNSMSTLSALTADQGRSIVDSLAAMGADFIKVYELSRDTYFAIADQAAKRGISIVGHLSPEVTLEEAANAGQRSIEHYTRSHPFGLLPRCSSQPEQISQSLDNLRDLDVLPRDSIHLAHRRRFMKMMVETYDEKRCRTELARLGEYETWHTPTLTMGLGLRDIFDDRILQDPRFNYVTPEMRAHFQRLRTIYISNFSEREVAEFQHVVDRIIVNLNNGNVRLMAGADVSDGHGFALHGELESLMVAGLTNIEVLRTATINPALFLGLKDDLGNVEEGKLADLLLLDANPLVDITNTQKIQAVVANGRYFDRQALDEMLSKAEQAAKPQEANNPKRKK